MRRHTARLAPGVISVQRCTSSKLRPQPLHCASPWLVEQIAMQGVSAVVWYQASQASRAATGSVASSASLSRKYTNRAYTSASARSGALRLTPSGDGARSRQWLMAASMSVMWMPGMGRR